MPQREVHPCQCPSCRAEQPSPRKQEHRRLNVLLSRLDEQQRRWLAAAESLRLGHGGDVAVSRITGMDVGTISRGRAELEAELKERPADRIRLPGGGRPCLEKKGRSLPLALSKRSNR